ncbi:hypothetical protein ADUPG1_009155 [Aduncisulcus paluster]|uniref:non-specific serine/threonine protein kinase n=1 Tax=Aduncisulcus paluster TaxID=2918883 RepID=A0ABQ5KWU5_9EUKA|nr:hypothetical protein ADUPG1_009155 [Aduncisulcus paluster]
MGVSSSSIQPISPTYDLGIPTEDKLEREFLPPPKLKVKIDSLANFISLGDSIPSIIDGQRTKVNVDIASGKFASAEKISTMVQFFYGHYPTLSFFSCYLPFDSPLCLGGIFLKVRSPDQPHILRITFSGIEHQEITTRTYSVDQSPTGFKWFYLPVDLPNVYSCHFECVRAWNGNLWCVLHGLYFWDVEYSIPPISPALHIAHGKRGSASISHDDQYVMNLKMIADGSDGDFSGGDKAITKLLSGLGGLFFHSLALRSQPNTIEGLELCFDSSAELPQNLTISLFSQSSSISRQFCFPRSNGGNWYFLPILFLDVVMIRFECTRSWDGDDRCWLEGIRILKAGGTRHSAMQREKHITVKGAAFRTAKKKEQKLKIDEPSSAPLPPSNRMRVFHKSTIPSSSDKTDDELSKMRARIEAEMEEKMEKRLQEKFLEKQIEWEKKIEQELKIRKDISLDKKDPDSEKTSLIKGSRDESEISRHSPRHKNPGYILTSPSGIEPLCIIGLGGFGEVTLVRIDGIAQLCILKRMIRIGDKKVIHDCKREFKFQQKLFMDPKCFNRIPRPMYILNLLDEDTHVGVYGFIMEYCAGGSVSSFARSWGLLPREDPPKSVSELEEESSSVSEWSDKARLSANCMDYDPLRIAALCVGCVECLDDVFMANSSIIHRDVKPDNFLVRIDEYGGSIVLGDLGLIMLQDCVSSSTGSISFSVLEKDVSLKGKSGRPFACGTFVYNSYESLSHGIYSQSSDAFALGLTIYSLFTAKVPFFGHPLLRGIVKSSEFLSKLLYLHDHGLVPKLQHSQLFQQIPLLDDGKFKDVYNGLLEIFDGLTKKNPTNRMSVHSAREICSNFVHLLPKIGEGWICPSIDTIISKQREIFGECSPFGVKNGEEGNEVIRHSIDELDVSKGAWDSISE